MRASSSGRLKKPSNPDRSIDSLLTAPTSMHKGKEAQNNANHNFAAFSTLKNGLLDAAGSLFSLSPGSPWSSKANSTMQNGALPMSMTGSSRKSAATGGGGARGSNKRGQPRKPAGLPRSTKKSNANTNGAEGHASGSRNAIEGDRDGSGSSDGEHPSERAVHDEELIQGAGEEEDEDVEGRSDAAAKSSEEEDPLAGYWRARMPSHCPTSPHHRTRSVSNEHNEPLKRSWEEHWLVCRACQAVVSLDDQVYQVLEVAARWQHHRGIRVRPRWSTHPSVYLASRAHSLYHVTHHRAHQGLPRLQPRKLRSPHPPPVLRPAPPLRSSASALASSISTPGIRLRILKSTAWSQMDAFGSASTVSST